MSSTNTATSLSFKPWTTNDIGQTALKDILARVNLERGHFRDITEASLQEEIAAEGALSSGSSDGDENEEQDEVPPKQKGATTREELYAAKREMLDHVFSAHNEVMMALDFISLLESKHALSQANVSMSQELKARVPPASLGTDAWDPKAIPVDPARQAQDALLASKVRMAGLQQSADHLVAAATRLHDNVRKEAIFWNQIVSISEKGWSVSKIPGSHLLGVHFGFNGSAPEFARKNVAALMPGAEGEIALERGVGTRPKSVRATIRKDGRVTGISRLPSLLDADDTTLEGRIQHARDSVYDEELFREMIREARTLTSTGVYMKGPAIGFDALDGKTYTVEFELVSIDEASASESSILHETDHLAQATLLAARLLLGQEHRLRSNMKKEIPPPLSDRSDHEQRVLSIVRPLMLLCQHYSRLGQVNSYVGTMGALLQKAKIPAEPQLGRFALADTTSSDNLNVQSLIEALRSPLVSRATLCAGKSDDVPSDFFRLEVKTHSSISLGTEIAVHRSDGKAISFSDLEDAFMAADSFVAFKLGEQAREVAGPSWTWDARECLLSRKPNDDGQQQLWFGVDGSEKKVTLSANRHEASEEFVWSLDEQEEQRSLRDVCSELIA